MTTTDAGSRFVEIMKACAAGNNTIGNMLCWDRSDLPVSPALTQQYLPQVLVPSCDAVGYIDSPGGPTQFTSPQAAPCINPTGSSLLQYKDEARDGYIDPRAYKRTSRLVAPLAYTQKVQSRGPTMIADVTSNLGTSDISKAVGLGFTQGGGDNNYERMKQKVNDELKKHFRPEFLNRIDDIIVFHQLTRDEIIEMVDLMVTRVGKQLKAKDMEMELTDRAKALLAKRGFDPVLGARPLRRTIQREIEDALSEKILFEEVGPGQLVTVDVENWDGEGAGENARFTFSGGPKREVVEPDLADAAATVIINSD